MKATNNIATVACRAIAAVSSSAMVMSAMVMSAMVMSAMVMSAMVMSAQARPPEGQFNYMVNHSLLGCVSLTRNIVTHEGDRTVIVSDGDLLAKVGPFVIRSEDFDRREVHENGRLVEYASITVENRGRGNELRHEVSTQFQDGTLTVSTPDGDYRAAEDIFTTNPLFIEAAGSTDFIGAKTGVLHSVEITRNGIETVELESGDVQATHYAVSGTSALTDLWYDADDLLVRFIVSDGGDPVEVILTERASCDG